MNENWNPWVWIKWKAGTPTSAWEAWQGNDKIHKAWTAQGEWDCCLWLNVKDHDDLEQFVWKNIRNNEWVASTWTMWAKPWW